MNLIQRVTDILIKPDETWPEIEKEAVTGQFIYKSYLRFLAAIPALAFLAVHPGGSECAFGLNLQHPFFATSAKVFAVYALALLTVFILTYLVDSLAPTFGGESNRTSALKLVAYSATAGFASSIFYLDSLWVLLGSIGVSYALHLVYVGMPVMMKCPTKMAGVFISTVMVWAIFTGMFLLSVATWLLSSVPAAVRCTSHKGFDLSPWSLVWSVGLVVIFVPLFAVVRRRIRYEQYQQRQSAPLKKKSSRSPPKVGLSELSVVVGDVIEAAEKFDRARADSALVAQEQARVQLNANVDAMVALLDLRASREPYSVDELESMFPMSIGQFRREVTNLENARTASQESLFPPAIYTNGEQRINMSITDFMGRPAGPIALAKWVREVLFYRPSEGSARVFMVGSKLIREEMGAEGQGGRIHVLLSSGVMLEFLGQGMQFIELKKSMSHINLGAIEAIERSEPKA